MQPISRMILECESRTVFQRRRSGVTLVEVMVVFAIVGLLLALLLPAVQIVREVSRRSNCTVHLAQISIAVGNYEARVGVLPYDSLLELHHELELPLDSKGRTIAQSPLLKCPSDPLGGDGRKWALAYRLSNGMGYSEKNGVIGNRHKHLKWADVVDGLSTTAMCSERLLYPSAESGVPVVNAEWERRGFWTTVPSTTIAEFAEECQSRPRIITLTTVGNLDYNHIVPPNAKGCFNGLELSYMKAIPPTSLHPQGVNVAFCDGHVQFISNTISQEVWWAIGTRNGNEQVSF